MPQKRYYIAVDKERCKGCELCVAVCPRKVLELAVELNSRGQHVAHAAAPQDCIGCLQCADICPDAAIEIDEETDADA
jgi:2-oxoglutarate ferredoxin oxidoreductase subunit delta